MTTDLQSTTAAERGSNSKKRSDNMSRPAKRVGSVVAYVLVLAAVVGGVFAFRAWRTSVPEVAKDPAAAAAATMPKSADIEAKFGVRVQAVALTANGGMLQIRYLVLDATKAAALHEDKSAPYITIGDTKLAEPGLSGHGHSNSTPQIARAGSVLIANTQGAAKIGSIVAVHFEDLKLDHVTVLG